MIEAQDKKSVFWQKNALVFYLKDIRQGTK